MLSEPVTPPSSRAGCTACPGCENVTPRSKMSMLTTGHSSSGHRSLGRRSLEAVRSIGGTIKGRMALEATTNNRLPAATVSMSANFNPISPPTKQRWFGSLRSRVSQIPTPTRPSSMSPTLTRTRFFRSSDTPPPQSTTSSSGGRQTQIFQSPLPKLDLPSFQSDLQASAIFRPLSSGKAACGTPMHYHMLIGFDHAS